MRIITGLLLLLGCFCVCVCASALQALLNGPLTLSAVAGAMPLYLLIALCNPGTPIVIAAVTLELLSGGRLSKRRNA